MQAMSATANPKRAMFVFTAGHRSLRAAPGMTAPMSPAARAPSNPQDDSRGPVLCAPASRRVRPGRCFDGRRQSPPTRTLGDDRPTSHDPKVPGTRGRVGGVAGEHRLAARGIGGVTGPGNRDDRRLGRRSSERRSEAGGHSERSAPAVAGREDEGRARQSGESEQDPEGVEPEARHHPSPTASRRRGSAPAMQAPSGPM